MYLSLRWALFLRSPAGDDITNSSHGSGQFIIVKIRFPIIIIIFSLVDDMLRCSDCPRNVERRIRTRLNFVHIETEYL